MVDVYHSDNFDELEAARLGEPESSEVVTKDVKPEDTDVASAEVETA